MRIKDLVNVKTFKYNWEYIETIPEFAKLKECEQNPKWHGEGNAWIHTQKVCEEAVKICHEMEWYHEPTWATQLLVGALFHDIGKGVSTIFKKDAWHAYGHEMTGEKITRRLLWDEGFEVREAICSLVKWHMEPLRMFEHKDYISRMIDMSKNIPSWHMLLLLKKCDILGSQPSDSNVTKVDLLKLEDINRIVSRLQCYYVESNIPYRHQLKHTTIGSGKKTITVHLLFGLPGAGKSTAVNEIVKTITGPYSIVSRDLARVELGFCKEGEKMLCTENQEKVVTEKCADMILTAAALGETIIIDNISLKKLHRESYHTLLKEYDVIWIYDYAEASSLEVNIKRREGQIRPEVFKDLVYSMEWPSADEYDQLRIYKS